MMSDYCLKPNKNEQSLLLTECFILYDLKGELNTFICSIVLQRWLRRKESACQCRRYRRCRFDPWVGKIPCRRKRQPSPVFLPGESHGQRSLVGCSPCGRKESDRTELLSMHAYTLLSLFENKSCWAPWQGWWVSRPPTPRFSNLKTLKGWRQNLYTIFNWCNQWNHLPIPNPPPTGTHSYIDDTWKC